MIGACRLAEDRVLFLIDKYGLEDVLAATHYILDSSERRVRERLAEWPDGKVRGRSVLDGDYAGTKDINVDCTIEIDGDEAIVDFTGSSPQVRGYVNSRPGNTGSWVYSSFSVVFPDIPINSGFFRPISTVMPEGTVVHALPPAPVGNSTVAIGNDIGQAVMKCLEQIVPELVGAAGLDLVIDAFYGQDPRLPGDPFYVSFEYFATPISSGAAYGVDGWGAFSVPHSTVVITTVELQEVVYPILYLQCEYATDTAAPGRWRGTPAWHCRRQNPDGATVIHNLSLQGVEHPLQGYAGGADGVGNYVVVDEGGPNEQKVTHVLTGYASAPGEVIMYQSGGAGGWGPAFEREPASVLTDVRNQLVSIEAARRDYGVVVTTDPLAVDEAATRRIREEGS
jgi:N-methylhydantoinase B